MIELKLELTRALRNRRKLTQEELGQKLGSSQSRVAKMEAGDSSVSIDLLVRALLSMGSQIEELSRILRRAKPKHRVLHHA